MKVDRPIFLLGPGRAGSTLLNNLLTQHRDVGYFTSWSNRYPKIWPLALGARLRWWRLESAGRRIRFYPNATEAYRIWKHLFPDFWNSCRTPCTDEASALALRRLIRRHLWIQGKRRFLAKLTGPPMFDFFRSMFPDARFLWMDRDPRAVVLSYSKGNKVVIPPGMSEQEAEEEALRQSARRYLEIYEQVKSRDGEYYWLNYGDFVSDPVTEMSKLLDYLELRDDPELISRVRRWRIRDADEKWRRLPGERRSLLNSLLERPLRDQGHVS